LHRGSIPTLTQVYNSTLEQRLTGALRDLVISGELEPGFRLRYRELAKRFGVSTTPVRAAVRDLANEGLAVVRPNAGAHVAYLTLDELEEVYLGRIGLEPWLARVGAPRLSEEQLALIETRLKDFEELAASRDRDGVLNSGWRLREPCYSAAGRSRVFESAKMLYERAQRYNRITLIAPSRFDESRNSARGFYEACVARDGARAGDEIRRMLERSLEDIAQRLPESPPDLVH
jgi:DNA-binding GntR family transcriptional regulator